MDHQTVEAGNPSTIKLWPYVVTLVAVPLASVLSVVTIALFNTSSDRTTLITQILGFGMTITVAILAYLKTTDTHAIVNSRMDEFKRTIQLAADVAISKAYMEGKEEGRGLANDRTDTLAANPHDTHEVLFTYDQWEREKVANHDHAQHR